MIDAFEFNQLVGSRIRERRLFLHYTREYLAEITDISPKFLYEIEMGKKGCSAYIMYRLACSLDVTTDYIFNGTPSFAYDSDFEDILATFSREESILLKNLLLILCDFKHN